MLWRFINDLNNQAKRTQLAIAAVTMVIGFLIVMQIRVQQTAGQALQAATEEDLGEIASNLNNQINMLKAETASLKLQLFEIERANKDSSTILNESSKSINNLKILAGITEVRGPGIRVRINDENGLLTSSDLVDIVSELRGGGAEAISINGIRVVSHTGIIQSKGMFVDQKLITPPYEILAIGDSQMLYDALTINGGVRDKLTPLSGVSFYLNKEDDLQINPVISAN